MRNDELIRRAVVEGMRIALFTPIEEVQAALGAAVDAHRIPAVKHDGYARGFAAGIEAAAQAAEDWFYDPQEDSVTDMRLPDTIRALTPADAPPEPVVRVKALAWEPSVIGKPWHSAKCPWGFYYAQWDDETKAWFASLEMGEVEHPIILSPSDVDTIEAAKSAAQADYDARILAAIETVSEADVRADERAKVIAEAVAECRKIRASRNETEAVKTGAMVAASAIIALHTPASRAAAEKGGAL